MLIARAREDSGRNGMETKRDGPSKQRLLYKVFCFTYFNIEKERGKRESLPSAA